VTVSLDAIWTVVPWVTICGSDSCIFYIFGFKIAHCICYGFFLLLIT